MTKTMFTAIFLIISAIGVVVLIEMDVFEKFIGFSIIPIALAYFLGQYSERKFNK